MCIVFFVSLTAFLVWQAKRIGRLVLRIRDEKYAAHFDCAYSTPNLQISPRPTIDELRERDGQEGGVRAVVDRSVIHEEIIGKNV